jgi:preprotein translocase subunit SecD
MKHLFFFLTVFCILTSAVSCSNRQRKSDEIKYVDLELIYKQNVQDSTLATGWYHVLENENGFKRQLDKTEKFYFIDPNPILVKEHFGKVTIETNSQRNEFISIRITQKDLWADATEKSIGQRIGLVIDNKLVNAPMVNARIEGGISSLWGYDREELENFKKQLE